MTRNMQQRLWIVLWIVHGRPVGPIDDGQDEEHGFVEGSPLDDGQEDKATIMVMMTAKTTHDD